MFLGEFGRLMSGLKILMDELNASTKINSGKFIPDLKISDWFSCCEIKFLEKFLVGTRVIASDVGYKHSWNVIFRVGFFRLITYEARRGKLSFVTLARLFMIHVCRRVQIFFALIKQREKETMFNLDEK